MQKLIKIDENYNEQLMKKNPKIDQKSTKNRSGGYPKCVPFFDGLLDRLLRQLGANLAPKWMPKPSQN